MCSVYYIGNSIKYTGTIFVCIIHDDGFSYKLLVIRLYFMKYVAY